jgi:hypothetical protein
MKCVLCPRIVSNLLLCNPKNRLIDGNLYGEDDRDGMLVQRTQTKTYINLLFPDEEKDNILRLLFQIKGAIDYNLISLHLPAIKHNKEFNDVTISIPTLLDRLYVSNSDEPIVDLLKSKLPRVTSAHATPLSDALLVKTLATAICNFHGFKLPSSTKVSQKRSADDNASVEQSDTEAEQPSTSNVVTTPSESVLQLATSPIEESKPVVKKMKKSENKKRKLAASAALPNPATQ